MALPHGRGRSRNVLALLVLTAITFLTLDFRGFGPLEDVQQGVRSLFAPVQSGADSLFSPVTDLWEGVTTYDDLQAENEQLRARLDELQGRDIETEIDALTLERFLEQVDIEGFDTTAQVVARVTRRTPGNFETQSVEIDKGTSDGIASGDAVTTSAGLVGIVTRADGGSATVRLISDTDFNVGVRLISGEIGVVSGTGRNDLLDLQLLDTDVMPDEDGPVVTLGESGGSRFPADLAVGRVVTDPDLLTDEDPSAGLFVEPSATLGELDFLTVLIGSAVAEPVGPTVEPVVPDEDPLAPPGDDLGVPGSVPAAGVEAEEEG